MKFTWICRWPWYLKNQTFVTVYSNDCNKWNNIYLLIGGNYIYKYSQMFFAIILRVMIHFDSWKAWSHVVTESLRCQSVKRDTLRWPNGGIFFLVKRQKQKNKRLQ